MITVASIAAVTGASAETAQPHRMAIHVGGGDPTLMHVALHNIINAAHA